MQEKVNKFSNIKLRVLQFVEDQNIKKVDFFNKIDVTSANFRGNAQNTPLNSTTIENIITHYPKLNLYWLVTGTGEMLLKNSYNEGEVLRTLNEENHSDKDELIKTQKKLISNQEKQILDLEAKLEGKAGKRKTGS